MAIDVRMVRTAKDRRLFIYFPEKLYEKRYPNWVHPIYRNECETFDPGKNDAWSFCDGVLFLARREGKVVGRIMGIINHKVNELKGQSWSRFGFFDCIDDQEVATALLHTAEDWARSNGCARMVGPLGFTDLDPEGMLVEGFKERTSIGTWWHPPYTSPLVEGAGYAKEIDWFSYLVDLTAPLPSIYRKIAERLLSRSDYTLKEFTKRSEIKPLIKPIFVLVNEAHLHLYGFSPLSEKQIKKAVPDYIRILDPRFAKVVTLDDELVGFSVGIPDMTEGIRAARGRLFPFGIFKVLRARRRSKRLDMLAGAIRKEHRGKGLDVLMANALYTSARRAGITHADSRLILENNIRMRAEMERLGGRIYKRYRLFGKDL